MFLRIQADSETLMLLVLGGGLIVALAVGIAAVKICAARGHHHNRDKRRPGCGVRLFDADEG